MKHYPPFLEFLEEPSAGRVTRIWSVVSTVTRDRIGFVEWYAPWRRYTFRVERDRLALDVLCLRQVADFCEKQMDARRVERLRRSV